MSGLTPSSPKVKINRVGPYLLLLFLSVFFLRPVELDDVWWHLSAGRHIVQTHQIPSSDPFSSQLDKLTWTHTQWLGSVVYFLVADQWGETGLQIFRVFLFLIIFGIFFAYAHRKIPVELLVGIIFLMSFALGLRSSLRPYVFNFLFISVLLVLLFNFEKKGEIKYLWPLPFVGALWSNLHLGSFIFAAIILGIFALSYFLKLIKHHVSHKSFFCLLIFIALYYTSFMISPYGVKAVLYPLQVIFNPQTIGLYEFNAFIAEQQPPEYLLSLRGTWFYLLTGLYICSVAVNRRDFQLRNLLLFISALFLFFYSQRASAFFAIIAGYMMVENFAQARTLKIPRWTNLILIFILVINVTRAVNKHYYENEKSYRKVSLRPDLSVPAKISNIIRREHLKGNIFNFDKYGGYLLWHHYPDIHPFVDGRQLDRAAWRAYRAIVSEPENVFDQYAQEYDFQLALIDTAAPYADKILKFLWSHPRWQLISIDHFTVLFVKRGAFILSDDLDAFESMIRERPVQLTDLMTIVRSKTRDKSNAAIEFLFPDPYFIDVLQEELIAYNFQQIIREEP